MESERTDAEPAPGTSPAEPPPAQPPPAVPEPTAVPPPPAPSEAPALRTRRFPKAGPAVVVLIATNAVLLVFVILLGLMVFAPGSAPLKLGATRLAAESKIDEQVERVARRFANNFLTISYRTLDEDFERILKDTTGSFELQLERSLEVSRDRLRKAKAISTGRVTEVSVLTRSGDTATARAVVRRSIRNVDTPEPRVLLQSLEVTLVRTENGWKVADAGELPSPTS